MPLCILREQLADYDAWRKGFYDDLDAHATEMASAGITLQAAYRDSDDPNVVLTLIRFASREQGEAMLADPAMRATMAANGVDLDGLRVEWYEDAS
jgi:hypothetical protein